MQSRSSTLNLTLCGTCICQTLGCFKSIICRQSLGSSNLVIIEGRFNPYEPYFRVGFPERRRIHRQDSHKLGRRCSFFNWLPPMEALLDASPYWSSLLLEISSSSVRLTGLDRKGLEDRFPLASLFVLKCIISNFGVGFFENSADIIQFTSLHLHPLESFR